MAHGIMHGPLHRILHGLAHNTLETSFTGFGLHVGQSNARSIAGYQTTAGSDTSYGVSDTVGFAPALMNRQLATAPTDPMVWSFITGTETVRAYAPSGSNIGPEQTIARYMVKYGIAANPFICSMACDATSLRRHWLKGAGFPVNGGELYSQLLTFGMARQVEAGRKFEYIIWDQGETDTGDATDASTRQVNLAKMASDLRTDLGCPGIPFILCQVNAAQSASTFLSQVRAANLAFAAADPNAVVVNFDDIRLHNDPHYDGIGQFDRGDRLALAIGRKYNPTSSFNAGSGPCPWLQGYAAGYTAVASPDAAMPLCEAGPQDGDYQLLIAAAYANSATITLPTPAGFVPHGSQFESVSGAQHRTLAVFKRPVTAAILNANNGRMPTPSVDFATSTINCARIFSVRGPNKFLSDPFGTMVTGVNNANNTALTISGGSTASNNALLLIIMLTAGATNGVSTVTNASLTGVKVEWDGRYVPAGGGTVGIALGSATLATAGSFGTTGVTFLSTGINAGAVIPVYP